MAMGLRVQPYWWGPAGRDACAVNLKANAQYLFRVCGDPGMRVYLCVCGTCLLYRHLINFVRLVVGWGWDWVDPNQVSELTESRTRICSCSVIWRRRSSET